MDNSCRSRWLLPGLAVLLLGCGLSASQAAPAPSSLLDQAQRLEKQQRWYEACCLYDELLSRDRNQPALREAYRRCLRHFRQVRRHQDAGLQKLIRSLSPSESLDLYDEIVGLVADHYVDRDRVQLTYLFQEGIQELRFALQEKAFVERHLSRVSQAEIEEFRTELDRWNQERIETRARAKEAIRNVILASIALRLKPGVVALEFACGACNSLDEYSLYLSPTRYGPADADMKSKHVGIGIELTVTDGRVEIARVYRKSPAALVGLTRGTQVVRINGRPIDPLAPDLAAERLRGDSGTFVELEIVPRGQTLPLLVRVERQAVLANSVDYETLGEDGTYIGYLRIYHFQHSTLQEVKDALAQMQMMPLRGLILDLRGNSGGLFKSGLAVAELFLPESDIVHTHSQLPDFNRTYRSHNMSPVMLPMIVLVDGDTASSAEIVAAAMKDNHRATVLGQPTFGKGSIQCIVPLDRGPGGLRLTVAKFTSPARNPFCNRGVLPDYPVPEGEGDTALKAAEHLLRMTAR